MYDDFDQKHARKAPYFYGLAGQVKKRVLLTWPVTKNNMWMKGKKSVNCAMLRLSLFGAGPRFF
jgi:hypothetical protein